MRRAGARASEALILPAALLVVVVLSIFVVFTFRNALEVLVLERHLEADAMARAIGRDLEGRGLPRDDELARRRAPARAVALVDADGNALVASGDFAGPASRRDGRLSWWKALTAPVKNVISGTAGFAYPGRELAIQVDLPARSLNGAVRGLRILLPVVLVVDSALLILAGLYLHRYLRPFDRLLRRARESGRVPEESDELAFLLRAFEGTLEQLSTPDGDDLGALERTLSKSVESGLLLLDEAGRVLALNEIGAALLEVEPPSPGTPLAELLEAHPDTREVLLEAVRERRRLERRELRLGEDEGRTLGLTLHPLKRDDGRIRGFLAFFVDLTVVRRKAEERQLAESLAKIGELSAGVAHEMRNSLATLTGYVTLIERRLGRDVPERDVSEYVREIRRETDHLKRVVDDFLTFARPESARMEKVDLERLVRRAAADPALDGMAVRFESRLPQASEPVSVDGDSMLLERAFKNLLLNAAEAERAAGRGGPLEVILEADGDDLAVAVRDRGTGLPADIRDRLFDPFVSRRPGGVGLGLALTHRILELHHASVRLADREGGGAEARVRLRRETAAGASVTERNGPG